MSSKLQPQHTINVDGTEYIVQLYGVTFGLTLYAKLIRLLGEPVVKLIGMAKNQVNGPTDIMNLDLSTLNTDAAGEAIASLFTQLKDEDLASILKEVLSNTFFSPSLEAVGSQWETAFTGKYLHLFKLTARTLGVQYGDFLSGIKKPKTAAPAALASVPTGKGTKKS